MRFQTLFRGVRPGCTLMDAPFRILYLEDEPADVALVRALFEAEGVLGQVDHVATAAAYRAALEADAGIDLILSDYDLPGFDGLQALHLARTHRPDVPFIMVTGALGEERAVECMRQGATDFVLKHRLSLLPAAVRRALREQADRARRRRAEAALRHSEARFRSLFESAGIGISLSRVDDGRFVETNPALQALLGYSAEELEALRYIDITHPDDVERSRDLFGQLLRGERDHYQIEKRYRHRDGRVLWGRSTVTLLRDAAGQPAYALDMIEDITERKRAEEALRHSEARFRGLLDAAPNAIVITDAGGRIVLVNAEAERVLGAGREALLGAPIETLIPEALRDRHRAHRHAYAAAPCRRPMGADLDTVARRHDGTTFPVEVTLSPYRTEDGTFVISIIQDVTARREAEEALIAARDEAEAMSRLKSTFLANMSHEFRTPLAGIIGFAALLAEDVPEPHRDFAHLIERSGRRLLDTLNEVLDLSMLESGTLKLSREPLDLADAVRGQQALFEMLAGEKGLRLHLDLHPARASLDPACFSRIVNNLVGNAIKFTDEGEVRIEVGLEGERAVLRVRDTGIGIGEAFRPHLFEAFKQESTGTARSHEGMGLGLALTRQLVQLQEGTLEVESEKGRGSVFTVTFPAMAPAAAPPPRPAEPAPPAPTARRRVLALDDNPDMLLLLERYLEDAYTVVTATDEETALHLAAETPFDALLLDINLGRDRTGVDVLHTLREMQGYATVPAVAVTAYALPGDRADFLAQGFDAYLGKPFSPGALLALLDDLLTPRPQPEA